jgi:N-acetylglucosamine-6-sulfatase
VQADPYQVDNLYNADSLADSSQDSKADESLNSSILRPMSSVDLGMEAEQESRIGGRDAALTRLTNRLDALLMVLKTCSGRQCTHPWESLFPSGGVRSLQDALNARFDSFFEAQVQKVRYERCEKGYIAESEGPVWGPSQVYGMTNEIALD